jgi:eukaryotic translation initiation factor 2C
LTNNSEDALIISLEQLHIDNNNHKPNRPSYGKSGKAIKVFAHCHISILHYNMSCFCQLRTNFFPITIPDTKIYQYDINIDSSQGTASRRVKRRIWQLAEQLPEWTQKGLSGRVAHDHSTKLIAATELKLPLVLTVSYYDEDETGPPATGGKTYKLTFKLVSTLTTAEALR